MQDKDKIAAMALGALIGGAVGGPAGALIGSGLGLLLSKKEPWQMPEPAISSITAYFSPITWILLAGAIVLMVIRVISLSLKKKKITGSTWTKALLESSEWVAGIYAIVYALIVVYLKIQGKTFSIILDDAALVVALLIGGIHVCVEGFKRVKKDIKK